MKKRIATNLLKLHQTRVINEGSPHLLKIHELSYELIADMIIDVKRPFQNVCIHGRYPHFILPFIKEHNSRLLGDDKGTTITLVDHVRNPQIQQLLIDGKVKQIRYLDNADSFLPEQDQFDLVISALKTHHTNSEQDIFCKYQRTLKPDGALIGSSFVEGTLSELYWSYIMAENERYGGMSPKVMRFPALGQLGTCLTTSKFQLATILVHDQSYEFDSFVDLLTLLQQMGQTGYLRGRRKGVYKDLLIAASALYHSQFQTQGEKIKSTVSMSKYIGWKYHETQPKKLSRGPHVGSIEFADELRKHGGEVQNYIIQQGNDNPTKDK